MDDDELTQYLSSKGYPSGFGWWIGKTKDTVFGRYIIVDNSRSMLTRDGQLLVQSGASVQPCTRWKMVGASLQTMAEISHAAQAPVEISLLNKEKSNAVVVGIQRDDDASLDAVQSMLETIPIGNTPICNHIRYVAERIEGMEETLREQNKIAVILLLTDGLATDGNVAEAMRALEGLPVSVIISIYATEQEVSDYWHNVVASVKHVVDITVLNNVKEQATKIDEVNAWMTYGEPLHRLREFGVMIPAIDALEERPLSKSEIKSVAEILLAPSGHERANLPDPDVVEWSDFVAAVQSAANTQPPETALVFCPLRTVPRSWVDCDQLAKLAPAGLVPVTVAVANDELTVPEPAPSAFTLTGLVSSWWTTPTPTSPPIDPSTTNAPMPEEKQEQPVVEVILERAIQLPASAPIPVSVPLPVSEASVPVSSTSTSVPPTVVQPQLVVLDDDDDAGDVSMDSLVPSDTANPMDRGINNNSNNNNNTTIDPPVDGTSTNNGTLKKATATMPSTFDIPPYPISPADKSPLAHPNLTLDTAVGPEGVVDDVVEEDGLIAMQMESARSAAGDAALALTAAKKVLNESPQGEDSVDALEVVFKLEVAKSGADQALAELIGLETIRKMEMERQRAPTPGGALVAEAGSGFWNNLNLWPAYPPSTNTQPVTLDGNYPDNDPSLSKDNSENGQSNASKARFSLLREAEEKNDRLQELQRQLNADPSSMDDLQRDALVQAMQRAATAKADVDSKLRTMLTEVKKETSQAVAEAESALGRAKDDNDAAAVAEDKLRQAKIAERYLDDKLEEVEASMEEEKSFLPGGGLPPLSSAAVDAAIATGGEEGTFSGASSPQGSAFYMGMTGQEGDANALSGLLGITNAASNWFTNPEAVQAAKSAADAEIAALKEQVRSAVEKNERTESEVDKLQLQATKDDDELARLRRLLGEKTNQYEEEKVDNNKTKNELNALTKKYDTLTSAKTALDKQVEALTAQGKQDALAMATQHKQLEESAARQTAIVAEYKDYKDKAETTIATLQTQAKKDALAMATQHKQLEESAARQTALVAEYKDHKDKAETTIATLQTQAKKDEVDITALKKRISDLERQVKTITDENELSEDEIASLKKNIAEWEALWKKNAADIANANRRIIELEAALAKSNDELTTMTTAKTVADKEIASLTIQGQKDRDEIESLKKRIQELETHQVALVKEYQVFKTATEKTIEDLEASNKQTKDQMIALAKEYQSYKITSETTVNELNASLVKLQDGYRQHLNECKLAAEKCAKSIVDLEATNKQTKDQMTALAKEYQSYKIASETTVNECKVAAEKAATTIADLESAVASNQQAFSTHLQQCTTAQAATEAEINDLREQVKKSNEKDEMNTAQIEELTARMGDLRDIIADEKDQNVRFNVEINDLREQVKKSNEMEEMNAAQIEELTARMGDLRDIIVDEKDQNVRLNEQIEASKVAQATVLAKTKQDEAAAAAALKSCQNELAALRLAKEVVDRQRDDLEAFVKLPRSFDCPPDVGDSGRACVRPSQSQRPVSCFAGGYDANADGDSTDDDDYDEIPPPTTSVPTGRGPVWSSPRRPRSSAPTMASVSSPAPSTTSGTAGSSSYVGMGMSSMLPDLRPGGGQTVLDLSQSTMPASSSNQRFQPTLVSETTISVRGKIYRGRLETFVLPGELPSSSAGMDITSSLLGEALQKGAGTWFDFISPSM